MGRSSPFKSALLTLVVAIKKKEEETKFSSELFYGPSFFHKGTKTRKFACDEKKTKKKLYLLSVQLCLVRCEKNPEPRFSRERIKKKKKSTGTPLPLQKIKYKSGF